MSLNIEILKSKFGSKKKVHCIRDIQSVRPQTTETIFNINGEIVLN